MSRVIAGSRGSRRISVPKGSETRPTAERVREAVFSTFYSLTDMDGAEVLDLYAGSGAIGIEAVSRGARRAVFVEKSRQAIPVLRKNIEDLDLTDSCDIVIGDVGGWLSSAAADRKDVVYIDPPYHRPVHGDLVALVERGWLAGHAVVAVEHALRDAPVEWPEGLEPLKMRRYGNTAVSYARFEG
ncbi:16S rRNA (guanine(966)-N(2))-methyltransferase RsmD [Streptomyces pactum]|uniref:16S rRNA (Guanine(966)-N(2))-methyltransferase RsmD n=1 Tax=Streptomyces pactum TaxID=68249 RepID=A0ABS0NL58_9ACTN|nr:16S rRNA (guanine(966)-N(2))-methyltransferase RsmD [Streptomyces pactum]MBH5335920.1 16S rRNA (guanine(966)-N(2))-methyltransferase RsmD [Streptomyces pactum]